MPSNRYVYTKTPNTSASYLTCSEDSVGYRFGFNGMEKDDEIKGTSNSYDFGARIYDPRIGRWLSTDPLQHKYAPLSPYVFAANSILVFKGICGQWIGRVNEAEDGTKFIILKTRDGNSIQQVMQKSGKTQMRNKVEDYLALDPFFDNDRKGGNILNCSIKRRLFTYI